MKLVLLRHGESEWNLQNRFTGWTDVGLTEKGLQECHLAADLLARADLTFDICYTSVLKRAIKTLWVVLEKMDLMWLPVVRDWRLNERHYGALQGLNKAEMAEKYGEDQVFQWRRSFDVPPPALEPSDKRYPKHDRRYAALSDDECPVGESLQLTIARVLPCWHNDIVPQIRQGKRVLIAAHGNSLRGLVKVLDGIGDDEISGVNIPTGIPLVYELDADLQPQDKYYLGDAEAVENAMHSVANQGKAKR